MTDILLINLGKGSTALPPLGYDRTVYRFEEDGFELETVVAGLALWKHLVHTSSAPVSVRFAATREAWEGKEKAIREEVAAVGLDAAALGPPFFVEIPRSIEGLWSVLPHLEEWAEQHREDGEPPVLHMDLTHAWRAIPISQPWLALFLQRIGFVEIGVMGYGAYVPNQPPAPYIDLSAVMGLAEWAAGVRDFERYGRAGTLRELMDGQSQRWTRDVFVTGKKRDLEGALTYLRTLVNAAKAMEAFLPAGLPIELGLEARGALGSSSGEDLAAGLERLVPGMGPLGERLHRAASRFAWRGAVPSKGEKEKRARLDVGEIERELDLVEYWTELGAVGEALRALRELMVNRVLLARGMQTRWLCPENRKAAESALNSIRPTKDSPCYSSLPDRLRTLGGLWHEVCEERNAFAHAGMKPGAVRVRDKKDRLRGFIERFNELDEQGDGLWKLRGSPEDV